MLRQCAVLAVLGCVVVGAVGRPQHQYQPQQAAEVPPHLLRQYLADQGAGHSQVPAQTQVIPRPAHIPGAAPAPARVAYQQQEGQYQQQQYEAQPQYRPQPQPQPQPQYQSQRQQQEPEDYDPHPSYQFGFDVSDDQFTNYQNRKEQRDGDVIKGSYSVVDSDGFIRTVSYTADPKEGFKAEVSRQPTDIVVKVPTPKPQTLQPQLHAQPQAHAQPQLHTQPQQFTQPQQYSQPQQNSQPQQYSQPQQHAPRPQTQLQPQQYYRYEQ